MTDYIAAKQGEESRNFDKITGFQIMILRSALTRYPQAKRVIYSTCSIYPEENEDVVRQVLETNYKYKLVPASQFVNNTWKNFGSPDFGDIGKFCLYAKPQDDLTNGFFIAVFEKLIEGEENQFFNNRIFNYKKDVAIKEKRKKHREEKAQIFDKETYGKSKNIHKSKNKADVDHVTFEENHNNEDITHENFDKISENNGTAAEQSRKKKKKKHSQTDNLIDATQNGNEMLDDSQINATENKTGKRKSKKTNGEWC